MELIPGIIRSFVMEFHLLRPLWLIALFPLLVVLFWLWSRQKEAYGWSRVIEPQLLVYLLLETGARRRAPLLFIGLLWLATVMALAGPTWKQQPGSVYRAPDNWVIVLDLSSSMVTKDLRPDRVTRARYAVEDLLREARDTRVGLVVFAEEPHVVTPLTEDVATIQILLHSLVPDIMPTTGDKLAPALVLANELLEHSASGKGHVVVISDGFSDPAISFDIAQKMARSSIRLHVVGVGMAQGTAAPKWTIGAFRNANEQLMVQDVQWDQLTRLAASGKGMIYKSGDTQALVDGLWAASRRLTEQSMNQEKRQQIKQWYDAGVWLLPLILLLTSLLARRGWL